MVWKQWMTMEWCWDRHWLFLSFLAVLSFTSICYADFLFKSAAERHSRNVSLKTMWILRFGDNYKFLIEKEFLWCYEMPMGFYGSSTEVLILCGWLNQFDAPLSQLILRDRKIRSTSVLCFSFFIRLLSFDSRVACHFALQFPSSHHTPSTNDTEIIFKHWLYKCQWMYVET